MIGGRARRAASTLIDRKSDVTLAWKKDKIADRMYLDTRIRTVPEKYLSTWDLQSWWSSYFGIPNVPFTSKVGLSLTDMEYFIL